MSKEKKARSGSAVTTERRRRRRRERSRKEGVEEAPEKWSIPFKTGVFEG
jgi:hypothetical protein